MSTISQYSHTGALRRGVAALATAVVVALAAGCADDAGRPAASGSASSLGGPVTVTDALNRQVTFPAAPRRIVITGKAMFMISDAVYMFPEAADRVVALGKGVQYKLDFIPAIDPGYTGKTVLDAQAGVEQIVATRPDVVLLKSSAADSLGKPLEAVGVKVVYFDLETPQAYTKELGTLGALLGDPKRAEYLVKYFQDRTDAVTKAVAKTSGKPRVLVLYYSDKNGTVAFNVSPKSWINVSETQLAGGAPVWLDAQLGNGWTPVTMEQVAAWNPDQVYVITYFSDPKTAVAKLRADSRWQALHATGQHAIYAFPGDYYSWDQPDPRWILGLTWMATKVHPETAAGLNLDAVTRAFYHDLYRMDDAAFQAKIQPNLWGDLS